MSSKTHDLLGETLHLAAFGPPTSITPQIVNLYVVELGSVSDVATSVAFVIFVAPVGYLDEIGYSPIIDWPSH